MYSDFEFWDKIDDWPKDQPPSYEFCGKIDNHETIYEEMEKFDGWTHSFAEDFTEELIENIACLSGSTRDRWEAIQEKWKIYGSDAAPHRCLSFCTNDTKTKTISWLGRASPHSPKPPISSLIK